MYQIFNPINGKYQQADSLDSAKTLQSEIINNYFGLQNLFQSLPTDEYYKANQVYANEFVAIHYGEPTANYSYSVYNATTKQILSQVFICNGNLIKVSDNQVTEWYEANGKINGVHHIFVSLNVQTGEPIEYYDWENIGSVMNKYDLNNQFIVSTNFTPIPQDKKSLLDGFEYADTVTAWSDKSYGFCVEYSGLISIPYADCTPEQQAQLLAQRQSYVENNRDIFVVNQETHNEDGSVTWTVVDTSNW